MSKIHKRCSRCGKRKPTSDFYKHAQQKDGYRPECKSCSKKWAKDNKEKCDASRSAWYQQQCIKKPWYRFYYYAKERCQRDPYYTNCRFLLSMDDVQKLWIRDKAHLLSVPSIDRIRGGDYFFDNCRFIEKSDNCSKKLLPDGSVRWSQDNDCCINCGSTDAPAYTVRFCRPCYREEKKQTKLKC